MSKDQKHLGSARCSASIQSFSSNLVMLWERKNGHLEIDLEKYIFESRTCLYASSVLTMHSSIQCFSSTIDSTNLESEIPALPDKKRHANSPKRSKKKKQLTVHPVNPSLCLAPLSLLTNADPKPSFSAACANDRRCKRGVLPPNSATKPGDTGPPTRVESWNDDHQKSEPKGSYNEDKGKKLINLFMVGGTPMNYQSNVGNTMEDSSQAFSNWCRSWDFHQNPTAKGKFFSKFWPGFSYSWLNKNMRKSNWVTRNKQGNKKYVRNKPKEYQRRNDIVGAAD